MAICFVGNPCQFKKLTLWMQDQITGGNLTITVIHELIVRMHDGGQSALTSAHTQALTFVFDLAYTAGSPGDPDLCGRPAAFSIA